MEELKKEWREQFKERISAKEFGHIIHVDNLIHFISSLLAKQQEEFVKIIPEEKVYNPDERHWEDPVKVDGYNACIADIKSKLNI